MQTVQTIADKFAARGIAGVAAKKMHVKQAKAEVTLSLAKATVMASLRANAEYLRGNKSAIAEKQKCFKQVAGVYSVGAKYTVRYLRNTYAAGAGFYEVADAESAAEVCDALIEAVTAGELDMQVQEAILANKNMRTAK